MKSLIGKTLGGYTLVEEIGSGGLATVYKAFQESLQRWVAVKVLYYQEASSLARFQREAQTIARLRHRNIVNIYKYGEENGWPYIVMEYVEGGTLEDRLDGQPMEWPRVVQLVISLAEVLAYAHEQGVIHRDIKPSNILMSQEDWPLLTDFGLVKIADAEQSALTGTGVSMGTPSYVAPEQARGIEIDERVDMYSLGVVLFEMITGKLPFDYTNPNKILLAHISEEVPLPTDYNPQCPSELEKIILKAMQKQPEQRYANMQEMTEALRKLLFTSDKFTTLHSASLPPYNAPKPYQSQQPKESVPEPQGNNARLFLLDKKVSIPLPSDKDSLIIGRTHRQTQADIDLGPYGAMQAGVSRRHARLIRTGNDWRLDDMGSLNGTFVNNKKIEPGHPVTLEEGDTIRCSHLSLIFFTS